jgi:hypothetical protein
MKFNFQKNKHKKCMLRVIRNNMEEDVMKKNKEQDTERNIFIH